MGCWNATCGMSNLPIFSGQPVVSWAVVKKYDKPFTTYIGGGHSYPTDSGAPMWFGIEGAYNDYGGIEVSQSANSPELKLFKAFKKEISAIALFKENHSLELEKILTSGSVEDFYNECVERSEIFFNDFAQRPQSVFIFHVHKAIFEDAIQAVGSEKTQMLDASSKKWVSVSINEHFKSLSVAYVNALLDPLKVEDEAGYSVQDFIRSRGLSLAFNRFVRSNVSLISEHKDTFIDLLTKELLWAECMSSLRRQWTPMSGAGSQDSSLTLHSKLTTAIRKQIAISKKWWA